MRDQIRKTVAAIHPFDPEEKREIENVLAWIDSGEEMFRLKQYDMPPKHIVTYSVIFDPELGKILMTDHKKAGMWLCPGGHVDVDEHPRGSAIREAREELGQDFELMFDEPIFLTSILTFGLQPKHIDVALWYVFKGDPNISYDFDKREFHKVEWFDLNDVPTNTDPHMWRFIKKLSDMLKK
jgi:8-oxo-dGTP pyrophosphatase MutT (NUDIX family)